MCLGIQKENMTKINLYLIKCKLQTRSKLFFGPPCIQYDNKLPEVGPQTEFTSVYDPSLLFFLYEREGYST